jgi:2-iminobutanoate/2-iminopropanoate deaminase
VKKAILTNSAPAPIGPYSQAVQAGGVLYISGQIAINPVSGELVMENIEAETHQVLKNLGAILNQAGLTFNHVLSCSVFVKDISLFSRINEVYAQYFNSDVPPARALVQVTELPKLVNIEISAIAQIPNQT